MPTMEVTIYDDDGKIVASFRGPIRWHSDNGKSNGNVAALARKARLYSSPLPHQLAHPNTLKLHDEARDYAHERFDCPSMATYEDALRDLWFLWHDTPDMEVGRLNRQFTVWAAEMRLVYAEWLCSCFEAHGMKGRDARYTVRRYLSAFRRGQMRTKTFDAKLDTARERLEMYRRKTG